MRQIADTSRESRLVKARKILSIVQDVCGERLAQATCLDIGCGIGVIAGELATSARLVLGMDSERDLLLLAPPDLKRVQGDALRLPYGDAVFDLVICAQVYEHVRDTNALAAEIYRTLKPGGVCFFSGPNRLWPYEYHYRAWLVHWLPENSAAGILSRLGRGALPLVRLRTYWQLRRLWWRFEVSDYWIALLRRPEQFPGAGAPFWLRRIPARGLALVAPFAPNVNWVLTKPTARHLLPSE